jgi:hypothetical protein
MKWAIDVSGYDGRRYVFPGGYVYDQPMDWKKARDEGGLSLAIMKSSEGIGITDGAFRMNWTAAREVLPRAAYHFFRSNQNPIAQANHMKDVLALDWNPKNDFVILDFETQDGMTGAECLAAASVFLYQMEQLGTLPMIYTYPSFWNGLGGASAAWAKRYPLALAQWPLDNWIANTSIQLPPYLFTAPRLADLKSRVINGELKPMALKPWDNPALWQITARADAKAIPGHPGIKAAVDFDVVFMPLPALDVASVPSIPAPVPWEQSITSWARTQGYSGPDPEIA